MKEQIQHMHDAFRLYVGDMFRCISSSNSITLYRIQTIDIEICNILTQSQQSSIARCTSNTCTMYLGAHTSTAAKRNTN